MGCCVSKHAATSANSPDVKPVAATAVEKDQVSGLRRTATASDLDPGSVKEAAAPEESPAPAPRESEPEPGPDSLVQALSTAAAATASATKPCAKTKPCTNKPCGNGFAETWDCGATWHCFDCKEPIVDNARAGAERTAMQAVISLDAARAPTVEARDAQQFARAVSVSWLKKFLASLPESTRRTMTTREVVRDVIKPRTAEARCRFVELAEGAAEAGDADAFASHTWEAPFADLARTPHLALAPRNTPSATLHGRADDLAPT